MTILLREKLEGLKRKYEEVLDKINVLKADGNLAKLCNLRDQFDETFDSFFDEEIISAKYDWDEENERRANEKSNSEIEKELDELELLELITFYENYIGELEDQLIDLQNPEPETPDDF